MCRLCFDGIELEKRGQEGIEDVERAVGKRLRVGSELEAVITRGEKLMRQMSVIMADLGDWHQDALVAWKNCAKD